MALTPTTVNRFDDSTGDPFLVLEDGSGRLVQGVALVDKDGAHAGIPANPLPIEEVEAGGRYNSSALERQAAAFEKPCKVREVTVISTSGSVMYLHLFDRVGVLAGGEVPFFRAVVPAGGQVNVVFTGGRTVAAGLHVALSSSAATWTDPGTDEGLFNAEIE